MLVSLDQLCVVAALEDVAAEAVLPIEIARNPSVQGMHASRDVCFSRAYHEMEVVRQRAVRIAPPPPTENDGAEPRLDARIVSIIQSERRPAHATRGDVVQRVRKLNAARTTHAPTLRPVR